jgi:hypothetical protein
MHDADRADSDHYGTGRPAAAFPVVMAYLGLDSPSGRRLHGLRHLTGSRLPGLARETSCMAELRVLASRIPMRWLESDEQA